MPKTGVYQIKNLLNGKCYIGSTGARGIDRRWSDHRSSLARGIHHSIKLQRAWDKNGASAFVFEILEECIPEQCVKREQHYLDILLFASSSDNRFDEMGYNVARVAGSRLGIQHTQETRLKISRANKGKPSSNKGKVASLATRQLLSASHTGKRVGEYQGSKHPQAKLSDEDVKNIKHLLNNKIKGKDIARQYQVSDATISMIKRNHHWSHIYA